MRQDAVVGVFCRILRHADPEGRPLFHALENEIDSIGAFLAHPAQPGQDVILFADTFLGPLDGDAVVPGKSWMLDPSDQLAARLARDGDPEPIDFQETDTNFAIGWKGNYHIEGRAFVYADRESGRVTAILGYPTAKITQLG